MKKVKIGILGASGLVGQKAIELIEQSKELQVIEIATSSQHIGHRFGKFLAQESLTLQAPYILSALPKAAALEIEPQLIARGQHIFSNASAFRMKEDIPLLIPEINLPHLDLIKQQKTPGKLVCNPNCMVALIAPLISPIIPSLSYLHIVTLQAMSGAGKNFFIENNIIPNIAEEEEKIILELQKILGPYTFPVNVHTHRVPIVNGHSCVLDLHFSKQDSIQDLLDFYKMHPKLFTLYEDPFSPQPGRDLKPYDDKIHIGRVKIREGKLSLMATCDNLMRGAALGSLLNLRAFLERGW